MTPVMIEEFDFFRVAPWKIGPARWTAHTPWNGDFGDAKFIDPGPDGNIEIDVVEYYGRSTRVGRLMRHQILRCFWSTTSTFIAAAQDRLNDKLGFRIFRAEFFPPRVLFAVFHERDNASAKSATGLARAICTELYRV